ncbi:MAG TPA: sensor histidine kinase [Dehalococcoidia bacterium]|nr:sensor histidine kinase [Dehalococcoidia bacterium]
MTNQADPADVAGRAEQIAAGSDLTWVTAPLASERDQVLDRWMVAAKSQSFHAARPEQAVADHIPALYDAIVAFLARGGSSRTATGAVLDDPAILAAAQQHADARFQQGLQPVDIAVEFRLLRQELVKTLRDHLPDTVPVSDVLGAELLVHDALDGAVAVALRALADLVETVREDFLAGTVHDVRGPLTLMRAAAQLADRHLAAAPADIARARDDLARIVAASARMEALLDELVDASRVALHRLDLRPEPVDLVALTQRVVGQCGPEIRARIRLVVAPGTDPQGTWDPVRLERVVTNLLSNAAKYAPGTSPITVTVAGAGETVTLLVSDEGVGVAPEELPRLFQRYTRTADVEARGIPGLGLGLFVCRGIVEAHGGRIGLTSAGRGQGSTVKVVLPRTAPAAPTAPAR